MNIFENEAFGGLVDTCMEKIAPLLMGVKLLVNEAGVVNPKFIGQLAVQQRILQIQMDLEIYRLSRMFSYLAVTPMPRDTDEIVNAWINDLCKYLQSELDKYTTKIVQSLQAVQKEAESKIIVPGGQPKLVRPL